MEKTIDMNATKKAVYLAPQLTAVDVKPERGFAFSDPPLVDQLNIWVFEGEGVVAQDQHHVEVYSTNDNWTEGNNHFWD